MPVNWDRYLRSHSYRLKTIVHYLGKHSKGDRERFFEAVFLGIGVSAVMLTGLVAILIQFSASARVYGLGIVGVGATLLGWTAFRVHEKALREAALVPDDRKGDTPHQERVSATSLNYVYAVIGVFLIVVGYAIRIAAAIQ